MEITPALVIAAFNVIEGLLSWLGNATDKETTPLTADEIAAVKERRKRAEERYKEILKEIEARSVKGIEEWDGVE